MKLTFSGPSTQIAYMTYGDPRYAANSPDSFFVTYTNNKIKEIYDPGLRENASFKYDLAGNVTGIYDTVIQGNFKSQLGYFVYNFSNRPSALTLNDEAFALLYCDKYPAAEMLFQSADIPTQNQMYSYTTAGFDLISFSYQNEFYNTGMPKKSTISITNTTHYKYLSSMYYYTYTK